MSTIRTNSITDAAGTGAPNFPNGLTAPSITVGSLPTFQCRAWANFNGTTTPPTILASGNVSSVTRSSTGRYTVNFSAAMPDADYAAVPSTDGADRTVTSTNVSGSAVDIATQSTTSSTATNQSQVTLAVFR